MLQAVKSAVKQLLLRLCPRLFLYRADRPIVGCHLVGRGCGRTQSCVLGANARFRFETGYDGKGNGLTRLARHMPIVGEREEICNTPRPRPPGGFLKMQAFLQSQVMQALALPASVKWQPCDLLTAAALMIDSMWEDFEVAQL